MKSKMTNFSNWISRYGITYIVLVVCLILNGCTNGGSNASNGQLFFKASNIVMSNHAFSTLYVELTTPNTTVFANITVTSSNPNVVSVSPSNCSIANQGLGWVNTCQIVVYSLGYGSATIMASAPGFTSAAANIKINSIPNPGYLLFYPDNETVTFGSSRNISLNLVNSVNVNNLVVTINNSNSSIAKSNLNQCILSSSNPTCILNISGINLGNTTLTATAESYSSTTNSVSVINNSIPGLLSVPQNLSVAPGAVVPVTITLGDSSGVNNLKVQLTPQNSNALVAPNTCTLSTIEPTCQVNVVGETAGTDNIIVSAPGYNSANILTTVAQNPSPGIISFSSTSENVTVGGSNQVVIYYIGSGTVPVTITTSNSNITISPTSCTIGGNNPQCVISISGNNAGSTTIAANSPGYPTITNNVQIFPNGTINYGNLSLSPANFSMQTNSESSLTLTLNDSVGVNNLLVTLSTSQSGIVQLNKSSCTLSSINNTCTINATGLAAGSTIITASSTSISSPIMAGITVTSNVIQGQFSFDTNSVTVDVNGDTTANLVYTGGSNTFDVPITIAASNDNISIFPSGPTPQCYIGDGINNSCQIMILGKTSGQSLLTASSPGYQNSTSNVTIVPNNTVVYGNLSISPESSNINPLSSTTLKVTLNNSLNVENLHVSLTANPPNVVQFVNTSPCTLSTVTNSCYIIVKGGLAYRTTVITASASPYIAATAEALVQVVNSNAKPYLVWDTNPLGVGPATTGSTGEFQAILRLQNGTLTPVIVPIPANQAGTDIKIGGIYPRQNICTLTSESPVCSFAVFNYNSNNAGESVTVTAQVQAPNSQNIDPAPLTIIAANFTKILSPSRKITVVSYCPYPIYPGVSGAGFFSASSSCPHGSTAHGSESECYWDNPKPNNPYHPKTYLLNYGESLTFVIKPGNGMSDVGAMWDSTIGARILDESGQVLTNPCPSTDFANIDACPISKGFGMPQTNVEFTLLANGPDSYDIQNIDGIAIPVTITPSSYNVIPNGIDPYNNGIAGSTESAYGINEGNGQPYYLGAASWIFNPSSTTSGLGDNPAIYNLVADGSGDSCATHACSNPHEVCGYATSSINPNFPARGNLPNYALVCGQRYAYLTADTIWTLNPIESNAAPFQYESTLDVNSGNYPNSAGYPMWAFFQCSDGLLSGYAGNVTYPNACGCSNWDGITTSAEQCQGTDSSSYGPTTPGIGFNSAFLDYVLPRVTWIKQACPTCYAFQFDDQASTFVAWTPYQASASNPASKVNYTVTFCPNGIHIPQSD